MAVPRDAQGFAYQPDPSDTLDYGLNVSVLLDPGDAVAPSSIVISLSDAAIALGLVVLDTPTTFPQVSGDGTTIVFWLTVDPARRADKTWNGFGRDVPVSASFAAQSSPTRTYQRDFVITVRNR
jgi:hypothetical protein